jgi:threonine/homoserine/homoserine lactone efflux protein
MELSTLLRGLIIGFSVAAPVGPIGVLCIRRTLADGWTHGFASGLGAATADAIYMGVAGFGLTFISSFLVQQQTWFRLFGGVFLCFLGVKTFLKEQTGQVSAPKANGIAGAYGSTLVLTITNPSTILTYIAIFAGLGLGTAGESYLSASLMVLGVFIGSVTWWLILSGAVNKFRRRLTVESMSRVNQISGAIITGFGVVALLSLV